MSEPPPNTGPSPETLRNLAGALPGFIKAMAKKKIIGKGIPAGVRRARKVCKVCGLMFDYAIMSPYAELEVKYELCEN
jgi:hypothetical protein